MQVSFRTGEWMQGNGSDRRVVGYTSLGCVLSCFLLFPSSAYYKRSSGSRTIAGRAFLSATGSAVTTGTVDGGNLIGRYENCPCTITVMPMAGGARKRAEQHLMIETNGHPHITVQRSRSGASSVNVLKIPLDWQPLSASDISTSATNAVPQHSHGPESLSVAASRLRGR
jgi:hypothetical protein